MTSRCVPDFNWHPYADYGSINPGWLAVAQPRWHSPILFVHRRTRTYWPLDNVCLIVRAGHSASDTSRWKSLQSPCKQHIPSFVLYCILCGADIRVKAHGSYSASLGINAHRSVLRTVYDNVSPTFLDVQVPQPKLRAYRACSPSSRMA